MKITIKDKEFVPTRGTPSSAGYDLYVLENVFIPHMCQETVNTGVKVEIPEGYFGILCPRSSIGKRGLSLVNTIGIIDSDYRGDIILNLKNNGISGVTLNRGDRVAQLLIVPYISPEIEVVEELSETVRGTGGFGSTGA
jgi:dUTP pyrophosphatase